MRNPLTVSLKLLGACLVSLCLLNSSPQAKLALSQTSDNQLPNERQPQAGETLPATAESQSQTESKPSDTLLPENLPTISSSRWLTDENIPWSTPVLVKDKERGDYIAVFDRDYSPGLFDRDYIRPGVISNWSRHRLQVYAYGIHQHCVILVFVPVCNTERPTYPITTVALKIGDRVFRLAGGDSEFAIDEELASALREAGNKQVLIRFSVYGGNTVTRTLGKETNRAWKTIYQDAPPVVVAAKPTPAGEMVASQSLTPGLIRALDKKLPAVDGNSWRVNDDLPWSQLVSVKDPFDGNYVAVFDHDFSDTDGFITNWSYQYLWVHIYHQLGGSYQTIGIPYLEIKIGDQTFELFGENNRFEIPEALTQALREAPPNRVSVSYVAPDSKKIKHRIGNATLEAWKSLYQEIPVSATPPPLESTPAPPASDLTE